MKDFVEPKEISKFLSDKNLSYVALEVGLSYPTILKFAHNTVEDCRLSTWRKMSQYVKLHMHVSDLKGD